MKLNSFKTLKVCLVTFLLSGKAIANVVPNNLFSNSAVLQQGVSLPVSGTADIGEKITIEFAGQKRNVTANDGTWMVKFPKLKAGGPYKMKITGNNVIVINDILVGEIWFCSGQSNMEMPVGPSGVYRGVENYQRELKDVNYPQIRLLQVPHSSSGLPIAQLNFRWCKCDSASVYWSSAVSWFFAKRINRRLNVPIGIINSAWGGSAIQAWTPVSGLKAITGLEKYVKQIDSLNHLYNVAKHLPSKQWQKNLSKFMDTATHAEPSSAWLNKNNLPIPSGHQLLYPKPSSIYNAMVVPLIPFAIKGVIWYQGEANLGDSLYSSRMEALIKGWRQEWRQGEFPFYYVQVAPFKYTNWPVKNATPDLLPKLWEAQRKALKISFTGMVSTEDIGELDNIHPRKKKEVGERLAELALRNTYDIVN